MVQKSGDHQLRFGRLYPIFYKGLSTIQPVVVNEISSPNLAVIKTDTWHGSHEILVVVMMGSSFHGLWHNTPPKKTEQFFIPYMDVSENSCTPKSSMLIGFSIINHPFWGTPIFGNTHIYPNQQIFLITAQIFDILVSKFFLQKYPPWNEHVTEPMRIPKIFPFLIRSKRWTFSSQLC